MQQLPETILIDGVLHSLYTTPLLGWVRDQDGPLVFDRRAASCVRGYVGCWQIRDGGLWLIDLHAWRDGKLTRVPDLFGGRREVAAEWFSGPLFVEPAGSEVTDGASPMPRTLFVEAGRVTRIEDGFAAPKPAGGQRSHPSPS